MGFFNWMRFRNRRSTTTKFKMVTEPTNGIYSWNGKLFQSDIVRACIRPKVKAAGKMVARHIRELENADGGIDIRVNPDVNIKFLLQEPNPYMSGQMLQEKLVNQLCLNNNAFALTVREPSGKAAQIYPLPAKSVEAVYDGRMQLYLRFLLPDGKFYAFDYGDIIHLRQDFNDNDIFGESPMSALAPLMEIIGATDKGLVNAVKNSGIIRWLLKFITPVRPEDLQTQAQEFAAAYLNTESNIGVAAVDTKTDALQIKPTDYVPESGHTDKAVQRLYSFFGTNDKIVQSKYSEDDWIAYYEAELEPLAMQMAAEWTRKLFSRRERGWGNKIYFESGSLQFASMRTKLSLLSMVDRAALTPNEWRATLGLSPLPGGDKPIRRLDTMPIDGALKESDGAENRNKGNGYPE